MARVHGFSEAGWAEFQRGWQLMEQRLRRAELALGGVKAQENNQPADYFPVPFRNDSGETIPAYGVMRVTGVAGLGSIPTITVDKPSTTFQRLYLVNGPFQVSGTSGQNKFGLGTWAEGAAYVLYDDANTPAYGEEWGPSASSWKIKKNRYGFFVIGGATGGSTDIVACKQSIVNEIYGQTDGALNKGSTQTVSIFDGANSDTTDNLSTVNNRYGNVATTKKVTVRWHGGVPQVTSAECP